MKYILTPNTQHPTPNTQHPTPNTRRFYSLIFTLTSSLTFSLSVLADGLIQLGPQLTNPYVISNMQTAYNNVFSDYSNPYFSYSDIVTSHYYVRYLPQNEAELDFLKDDSGHELFDFPLDYEMTNNGTYYQDPSLNGEDITWQYTVVDKDHIFENIQYEILANLFLPEQIVEDNSISDTSILNQAYDLVDEAWYLSGNSNLQSGSRGGKWNPSGKIMAFDDAKGGNVAVQGAKVIVRNWFRYQTRVTDASGSFTCGNWRRRVSYAVKWESTGIKGFDVRNRYSIQVWYTGPKKRSGWNPVITSGKPLLHATIFRAADMYFYRPIDNLSRPALLKRLKLNGVDDSDPNGTAEGVNWGNNWQSFLGAGFPNIKIWSKDENGIKYKTHKVFNTVIHELAHTTHIKTMDLGTINYSQVNVRTRESWAVAVAWWLSTLHYSGQGVVPLYEPWYSTGQIEHKQLWDGTSFNYTPMFIDMVDNYNQDSAGVLSNSCPSGGVFNSVHCWLGDAPSTTSAFILLNHYGYTQTASGTCPLPGSVAVGTVCRVTPVPIGGFIYNNGFYYPSTEEIDYDSDHPKDEITGYKLSDIESNWLKDVQKKEDVITKLKANKPLGVTDAQIDLYFGFGNY
ncbi:MAG: hypothetical protein ACPGEG_09985 [Salibacteraceae bacterium]